MVNRKELEEYISKVPPRPEIIKRVLDEVEKKDLRQAGRIAKEDIVLVRYMQNLINKPIFGIQHKITDITQIFTLLGTDAVYELLHHYLLFKICPKKWKVFNLTDDIFRELQANLSFYWRKILDFEKINDKDISSAITLLPTIIIVCDELFHNSKEDLEILSDSIIIDYDFLLYNLTGSHLYDLSIRIGEYWQYSKKSLDIIKATLNDSKCVNEQNIRLGQWMHLLLFYILSKPIFINSNLNTFIKFDIDYIEPIYKDFEKALGEYF